MSKAVYKFHFDAGRSGVLYGLFVEKKERVEELMSSKESVYFGEVLGKHSEVYGPIEKPDISLVSEDENVIKLVEENDLSVGYNPFDYIDRE